MKYVDEYWDVQVVVYYCQAIVREIIKFWMLMEICGGQIYSIVKYGLDVLLLKNLILIYGFGCFVCVILMELIDQVLWLVK